MYLSELIIVPKWKQIELETHTLFLACVDIVNHLDWTVWQSVI